MMAMRYLYAHHRIVASLSPSSWLVLYANFIFSFSALSKQAMKLIRDCDDGSLIMCLLIASNLQTQPLTFLYPKMYFFGYDK